MPLFKVREATTIYGRPMPWEHVSESDHASPDLAARAFFERCVEAGTQYADDESHDIEVMSLPEDAVDDSRDNDSPVETYEVTGIHELSVRSWVKGE